MKKMQILSAVIVALLCYLFCLGAAAEVYSGTCGNDLTWTLDDAGKLTISGTGEMAQYSGISTSPWYTYHSSIQFIEISAGVTSIVKSAFYSCNNLTSVKIEDSTAGVERKIGATAFANCRKLENVTIGSGVTSIGQGAFWYCSGLKSVTIPDSVTSIGYSAFEGCTLLENVTIPDSVTSIGEYAFAICSSLKGVLTIPDGVTSIETGVFSGCENLESVTIHDGVTSIGEFAFSNCSNLKRVIIPGSVSTIGDRAFNFCGLTEMIIQDSAEDYERKIGEEAFLNCSQLKNVRIGSGVTSIGDMVFDECTNLESLTIPASLTSIGTRAFDNCNAIKDIWYCGTQDGWDGLGNKPSATNIHVLNLSGIGKEAEPYLIKTDVDWNMLADFIENASLGTIGKHFEMQDSFSVSRMIGTSANPFKGTFDGNGKTLTASIREEGTNQYAAPFRIIRGATIRKLKVEGTVTAENRHSAGLVGAAYGAGNLIENCWVAVEITNGDKYAGGILGHGQGESDSTTIRGCVFSGNISGKKLEHAGTIWGWSSNGATAVIEDCLDLSDCKYPMADRSTKYSDDSRFSNLYYNYAKKTASPAGPDGMIPGKLIHTVKTAENVRLEKGTDTTYNVSGITAYQAGIEYERQFYAGKDDELCLNPNLKPKDNEYVRYLGDDNQPLARGTGKTWLMPGRDVTIRAEIQTIEPYGTATFTLPTGTKTIGKNAFASIKAEVLYVPNEVQSIEAYAFANCPKLKQIRLPKDCIIDDAAFYGCSNLMAIYTSGDGKAKDWANKNGFGYMKETSQSGN